MSRVSSDCRMLTADVALLPVTRRVRVGERRMQNTRMCLIGLGILSWTCLWAQPQTFYSGGGVTGQLVLSHTVNLAQQALRTQSARPPGLAMPQTGVPSRALNPWGKEWAATIREISPGMPAKRLQPRSTPELGASNSA